MAYAAAKATHKSLPVFALFLCLLSVLFLA